jgi:hypothetical protein
MQVVRSGHSGAHRRRGHISSAARPAVKEERTVTNDDWASRGVNTAAPNVARIYDYFLGGKDNFAADREAADRITAAMPLVPAIARQNRAFVCRAVRTLAQDYGIRQFIDVGAGLPARQSVHDAARAVAPDARTIYVDHDPVVCSHGRALLEDDATAMVEADLRQPGQILDHPLTRSLINFDEPYALLLTAVLHFVPDEDDPQAIIAEFREVMAPGSCLVISHGTLETAPDDERVVGPAAVYRQASAELTLRPVEVVRGLFDGFELIEPGLVWISQWRPEFRTESEGETETLRGGVGRKPAGS